MGNIRSLCFDIERKGKISSLINSEEMNEPFSNDCSVNLFLYLFVEHFSPLAVERTIPSINGEFPHSVERELVKEDLLDARWPYCVLILLNQLISMSFNSSMYTRLLPENGSAKIDHQVDLFEKQHSFIN